jgi:hypothetical protein
VPFNAVVFGGLDFFGLPQRKFLEWTRGNCRLPLFSTIQK